MSHSDTLAELHDVLSSLNIASDSLSIEECDLSELQEIISDNRWPTVKAALNAAIEALDG